MYYDIKIFEAINGLAGQSKIIDLLGIFFAEYLPYLLGIFLLSLLFWPKKNKRRNRAMILLSITAAFIARFVVKSIILIFYDRPRPYINLPLVHKLISLNTIENLQSFPSGHTIFFFALSTVVYNFNKRLGIFFLVCSTTIAISRIFVGVHWPSDILAGAILGVIVGIIATWFYKNLIDYHK
ncbi:MAG: phosphatase PAP2 family protein [Candidatus Staskawiczbacteria bacterium]|nr:phosphatase PAP2 family protein [Candidatus Staskawiczbacteria bacterium]